MQKIFTCVATHESIRFDLKGQAEAENFVCLIS